MIAIFILSGVVALFLAFMGHRRRRKGVLAGLHSEKPQFTIEPPVRSLIRRGDHRW